MIVDALGDARNFYQADITTREQNAFATQLAITGERYVRAGWCDVLTQLANRIRDEQVHTLKETGIVVLTENHCPDQEINGFVQLADRKSALSLLALGKMRAYAVETGVPSAILIYPGDQQRIDIQVGNISVCAIGFDISKPLDVAGSQFLNALANKLNAAPPA
jgi:hypothetical protein